MSSPSHGAVFLSYASQDASAARRICEALRAVGVEVWFDQNELVGGDAWDAKIRRQIKECRLFVPIISANTQARTEGYFRLEWRLADQRTHLMAKTRPFLLPVVIDETRDEGSHVPDSFTEVQWTRLPDGETSEKFCIRVQALLASENVGPVADRAPGQRPALQPNLPPQSKAWPRFAFAALAALAIGVVAYFVVFRPRSRPEPVAPAANAEHVAGKPDPVAAEIVQLRQKLRPDEWTLADFKAFNPVIDRLIQTQPDNADAWALRSIANSLLVIRNFDSGTKPLEAGKEAADRALRLTPISPLAELALGLHHVAMISRGGDPHASRPHIERGLAGLPPESLTRYAELCSFWLGYQFEGTEKSARAWLAAEPKASFPAWILAQLHVANRRPAEAAKWGEQASADPDITGVRAFVSLFEARYYLLADLAAARTAIDRVPTGQRGVHRVVASRFLLAMAEHRFDLALQELTRTPESMLLDRVYHGPKALLAGLAHQAAGRSDVAQAQFRDAERLLREELSRDADNQELRAVLALNLACLGRTDEARRELAAVEPLLNGLEASVYTGQIFALIAQTHGVLGDIEPMARWLRRLFTEPSPLPFTPASLRFDSRFAGKLDAREIQALLKEFASLDQPAAGAAAVDKSVAVLAFTNLSDDKANEYFSDGISEELLNVLAKVPGLKVTARTSSFHFKGKDTPVPEIARQLGVAFVLEGSVRKAGNKVRITAQLIKAADGFHVWSENFDRELKDIFAVQDEIAGSIVEQLRGRIGLAPAGSDAKSAIRSEVQAAQRGGTKNAVALEQYLQGQYFSKLEANGSERPIPFFQRAVELDPQFAIAWSALAGGYAKRASIDRTLAEQAANFTRAREAVDRALALEPSLGEAWGIRCYIQLHYDFDWKGARDSMRKALADEPLSGMVQFQQGVIDAIFDQYNPETYLETHRREVTRDPVNPGSRLQLAIAYSIAQRYRESNVELERLFALFPGFGGHGVSSLNYLEEGRLPEALAEAEKIPIPWVRLWRLGVIQAAFKNRTASDAALQELIKAYPEQCAWQIAEIHAYRGETDQAFAWLDRAVVQRDSELPLLKVNKMFHSLHGDLRWEALLRKLGMTADQLK